ncbi:MAG: DJ-1/PfpI family protein [Treponema sp.]|nr:DJ-1/PfpI family protein [Treponema sp.]
MIQANKRVLVFLAPGFEEIEALTPVDYLRRANIETVTTAVDDGEPNSKSPGGQSSGEKFSGGKIVIGSHNIPVTADFVLSELAACGELVPDKWDAVVVPGGPGAVNLAASNNVSAFIKAMAEAGKWVCAICAAPAVVLAPLGLLEGRKFTCYPGYEEKVRGAFWSGDRVVKDTRLGICGGIITSRGAGTAGEFSAAIIAALLSEADAEQVSCKVLLRR